MSWYLRPGVFFKGLLSAGDGAILLLGGPPLAALGLGYWVRSTWFTPGWFDWAFVIVMSLVFYGGLAVLIAFGNSRLRTKDAGQRELLPLGRCAACAFGLRSIPSEEDGCTVCPECGSAWRVHAPAITDGKDHTVIDAEGTKRRPCPEFQALRRRHREPRTRSQKAMGVPMWICFGTTLVGAALTPVPAFGMVGAILVLAGGMGTVVFWRLRTTNEVPEAAVDAALAEGRCPCCWGEFTSEMSACPACFAVWRIPSDDAQI
ncbi:MAG: hypothetical protein AAGF47_05840 [Planctomycetota bacterium]